MHRIIRNFEVAGIQLNGFKGVIINDVKIGPSSKDVVVRGYYSAGRFVLQAYYDLMSKFPTEWGNFTVNFSGGNNKTLQEIFDELRDCMDIVFRRGLNRETKKDKQYPLRQMCIKLFENPTQIPDGSAIYGLLLNSKGVAVNGFGDSSNLEGQGEDILVRNVDISDLMLDTNEIPAIYFSECDNSSMNIFDPIEIRGTIPQGPFGEILDVRLMFDMDYWDTIDKAGNISSLPYVGNPLSNAQLGLYAFYKEYNNASDIFGTKISDILYEWAMEGGIDYLPDCVNYICNSDLMFHTNKGIVGIRVDGIENAVFRDICINDLTNKGPLASEACGNYSSADNGGNLSQLPNEGNMQTDIRGISIIGSDVIMSDKNKIKDLVSFYGDVIGVDILEDSNVLLYKKPTINKLSGGDKITKKILSQLTAKDLTPFPNNFDTCQWRISPNATVNGISYNETICAIKYC